MQTREKNLLKGLIGVVLIFVVLTKFEDFVLAPFRSKKAQVASLQETVERNRQDKRRLLTQKAQLALWQDWSLPPDPNDAQRLYSDWLVELARLSGFGNIEQTLPSRRPVGEIYVAIPVKLTAEARLRQLVTFLFHFRRTKVLHQITSINIVSTDTAGDPLLEVTIDAVGLSVVGAKDRTLLFPRTSLAADLDESANTLTVESAQGFPEQTPFQIRIDQEFLTVTDRSDSSSWTVTRGAAETRAASHARGEFVELTPLRSFRDPASPPTIADYRELLEQSPFVKPAPRQTYEPALTRIPDVTVMRGEDWESVVRSSGWDPAGGDPVYSLGPDGPPGLKIEGDGKISFSPPKDLPAGTYPITVMAKPSKRAEPVLSTTFQLTLKNVNLPPVLTVPQAPVTALIGKAVRIPLSARDPDNSGPLTYRFVGDVPEGVILDPDSGEIQWTPAEVIEPGEYTLTLEVKDSGEPAMTATAPINIHVMDDTAQYTYLVGCLRDGETWTAWLFDRSQADPAKRSTYLQVGETFSISDIQGKVVAIDLQSMTYETETSRWVIRQEHHLRDSEKIADLRPVSTGRNQRPPSPSPPERGTNH